MATIPDSSIDDMNRQSARLEAESRNLRAEAEKLNAEQYKLVAEQYKLEAEKSKLDRDKMLSPWLILAQGLIAGAALMGAGVALAKLLIS